MAVNVAEFISVLRKIRDVIYPEVNTLYTNAVDLNETINTNKVDFETNLEQFNQDYEIFNQDIIEINDLVVSAQASATSASQSAQIATTKSNEIKAVTAQSTTLVPGSQATVSYNPVDGKITIGVPSGLKGDKGDNFTVNAVGNTAGRSTYDTQPTGFSFLDIQLALIYFKLSSTSGNWSTGSPFGKGDKGDPGAAGNGISGIVFLSTTHASGLSGQSGGTDTYRITYTNTTTFDFVVHNGSDLLLSSNNPLANGTANAGVSSQGSKSDHVHPVQTSISGNAGTATKLANARTITLSGDAAGTASFDGSTNVNINVNIPTQLGINPAGSIILMASNVAPSGYLKANGAVISRTTYADLFAAIGTLYGAGDGSTTFALPDLRGYFPRGWDDNRGVDTGRIFGSLQADGYLNHSHNGSTDYQGAHTHTYTAANASGSWGSISAGSGRPNDSVAASTSSAGAHTHTVTVAASTTGTTETRPKNIALLYCIKY